MSNTLFLAMWDIYGLETLINVSELEKKTSWAILQDEKAPGLNLEYMKLRARYNAQRHYEIYTFNASEELDKETIETLFKENPQFIVDWIRVNGKKLYSDRQADQANQVIS